MTEDLKVVTASEMKRVEELACAEGESDLFFMESAGQAVAHAVANFAEVHHLLKKATLLVGKGNNGGDAFAAGAELISLGFEVTALHLYSLDACTPLCKAMCEKFTSCGGALKWAEKETSFDFGSKGLILDGLVGTGFKGKAEGILALAIACANRSCLPIFSIDIPSGLNATTGEVETIAIHAAQTLFLGFPKLGFFLRQGWDHVGVLRYGSFGLKEQYTCLAKPVAHLDNSSLLSAHLPVIKRTRHKYERGYLIAFAGSTAMPGAAVMSCHAALRAGAGIVRLFHPLGMESLLSTAPFELIRQGWDLSGMSPVSAEASRAQAVLVGPGNGPRRTNRKGIRGDFQSDRSADCHRWRRSILFSKESRLESSEGSRPYPPPRRDGQAAICFSFKRLRRGRLFGSLPKLR